MNKKRNALTVLCVVSSAILAIVGLFLMPDRVTVNINVSGERSYMSKYIAAAFPFLLSVGAAALYNCYGKIFSKEIDSEDWKSGIKYLVFSLVGVFLSLWMFLNNI